MKASRSPLQPRPVRVSLVGQTAECLRQGLADGRWPGALPAEAELGRELGVSRGTLRAALTMLFQEGLLQQGGRGGRHVANLQALRKKPDLKALKGNLVRVLSPQPRLIIGGDTQIVFQTMAETLGRAGLHYEFVYRPGLWTLRHPGAALRRLTARPNTAGWVLYRTSRVVQQWFAHANIPTVVLGSIFPEVALSHVEFDLSAASRHAAGVFAKRGHRRMVFLSVEKATAGDVANGAAFCAAAAAAGVHGEVALYDDTVPGLCHQLDALLKSQPLPTAFLVAVPNHVQATIGHLTRRGFPVPKAAAVISRLNARLLAECIPSVARYAMNAELLGRNAARLMIKALQARTARTTGHCVIIPEYVDGETAGWGMANGD